MTLNRALPDDVKDSTDTAGGAQTAPINRVLITGGSGFLGINLCRYLLKRGIAVVSLDLVPFDYPDVKESVTAITGDIRDFGAVRQHSGAWTPWSTALLPCRCIPPKIFIRPMSIGTRNVLEAATEANVSRVVHISSTAVYGIPDHHPLMEDDRLDGVGPYGQAKIQAEMIALEYRSRGVIRRRPPTWRRAPRGRGGAPPTGRRGSARPPWPYRRGGCRRPAGAGRAAPAAACAPAR